MAKFLNLKKEASSFAGRVVEPALQHLNENAPVAVWSKISLKGLSVYVQPLVSNMLNCVYFLQDEAIDLLRTVIKLYPSSVNRHYSKVCPILMFNSFPILCECIAHSPDTKK